MTRFARISSCPRRPRRRVTLAVLAAVCGAALAAGGALAGQPLNPKDALAPIFRENPKLADPAADLSRLRNEGIAHYEGGLTLDRAITAFEGAYDIGHQPADAFNLALVYVRQNKLADARVWTGKALEGEPDFVPALYLMGLLEKLDGHADAARRHWTRVAELHPTDATLHYNLAMLAAAEKDEHTQLQELLRALELDPAHKSSLYQMYRYYQAGGNKEMAAATLKRFNAVKAAERFSRKERPFDESVFTRPLRDDGRHGGGFPFIDSAVAVEVERIRFDCPLQRLAPVTVVAPPAHEDLLGVCADGRLLRIAGGKAELLGMLDGPADEVGVAWIDGQGPRVLAAGPAGMRLSTPLDQAPLRFEAIDDLPARRFLLADFEHDGSLDILTDASAVPLMRVEGKFRRQAAAGTNDVLAAVLSGDIAPGIADLRRHGVADLVTATGGEVEIIAAGVDGYRRAARLTLAGRGGIAQLGLADLDNDGVLDLVAATDDGLAVAWSPGDAALHPGTEAVTRLPAPGAARQRFAIADLNNDGRRDIVTIDPSGQASVWLNTAARRFVSRQLTSAAVPAPAGELIAFDANRDGLTDIAYLDSEGALVLLRNVSRNAGASIDLLLNGRRSPPTGQLTQVELRKGPLYAYAQSAGGLVHFGLGHEEYAEIVRLEWPNGFVENKIKVDAATEPYTYLESERIAGSCPTVFVRTPDGFRYVTDAMITTAIGIMEARGRYFPFGEREHVVIAPGLLTPADGRLDIRLTEELRETTYIDRAALLAVDHPAGARLASTDRLAPGPAAAAPTYLARRLVPAARATFEGRDVTELLARHDRRYADTVHRTRNPGFAEPSLLELTLGEETDPGTVDAVYATGWFLAFDSTAVMGAFKGEAPELRFPELQEFVDGAWHSVGYLGIPAGQDRTAVLALASPLRSRQLRVLSGFSVYWDELAFSVAGAAPATVTELPLVGAAVRFHGFSEVVAREPEVFDYEQVRYGMLWSPMAGRFTNYGPAETLVGEKDGRYAVIGGGDELALAFQAPAAPPAAGLERSYVLVLDGHVKDADRYTARADSVEPMPTLAMTDYPPAPTDAVTGEDAVAAAARQRRGLDFTLTAVSRGKERSHD